MSEEKKPQESGRTVNTGGGAYVEGGVEVSGGGDFVGRDKTVTDNDREEIVAVRPES